RLRLPDRPQGLRRRDHRRPGELSADCRRRLVRRRARELRVVLDQHAERGRGVRLADPDPAVALADDGRCRGGGGRGGRRDMSLRIVVAALLIGALALAPLVVGTFTVTLLNYIGIYALAALGLVLLTGIGGLTSFGHAAFVGIGAYATAWLSTAYG